MSKVFSMPSIVEDGWLSGVSCCKFPERDSVRRQERGGRVGSGSKEEGREKEVVQLAGNINVFP